MEQIFTEIQRSYPERSDNHGLQKQLWQDVIIQFPAALDPQKNDRFSYRCASSAGDTGLAMLWIVQATLVQGIIHDTLEELGIQSGPARRLRALPGHAIGALAHSDDRNNPAVLSTGPGAAVTGRKNYITGGTTADFILLTARTSPEEKTSSIILLNTRDLPQDSFEELHLGALTTVSHARLVLDQVPVPPDSIIPLAPESLRRSIKRWSILERSLILESVLGLVEYLYSTLNTLELTPAFLHEEISSLVHKQQELIGEQITAARKKEKITERMIDLKKLPHMIDAIKENGSENQAALSTDTGLRLKDLLFLKGLMLRS